MTWWFVARAAGFTAMLAAALTICLGATASALPPSARRSRREAHLVLQLTHRSTAVLTLALLALHAVLLVLDTHVDISLPGALVPFTAGYRGVAVGLGSIAAYCLVVVAITGALRGRMVPSARAVRWWRPVHALAYLVWPLAVAHGLLAGTDTQTWWAWSLYGGSGVAVLGAMWWRLKAEDARVTAPLEVARRRIRTLERQP